MAGGYNTKDSAGATEGIHYYAQLADNTALSDVDTDVSYGTKASPNYTVAQLTSGIADRVTTIKAYAVTHKSGNGSLEAQNGAFITGVAFTIRRFRMPTVIVTSIERYSDHAIIHYTVADTGYGATQNQGQVNQIQYSTGGAFVAATLSWTGITLSGTFQINSLTGSASYSLSVKMINNAPGSTGLSNLTSNAYPAVILPYLPGFFVWKNGVASGNQAVTGAGMQAMIVGNLLDEVNAPVNAGCGRIQNDLDVGVHVRRNNNELWGPDNDGAGTGLDADTLDGSHGSAFAPATGSPNYAPATGSANYAPATGSPNYAPMAHFHFSGTPDVAWTGVAGTSPIDQSLAIGDNEVYFFEFYALSTAASTNDMSIAVNGVAISTSNYDSGFVYNGSNASGNNYFAWTNSTTKPAIAWGFIKKINGYACIFGESLRNGTVGMAQFFIKKIASGSITSIQVTAAASVAAGSKMNLWKI